MESNTFNRCSSGKTVKLWRIGLTILLAIIWIESPSNAAPKLPKPQEVIETAVAHIKIGAYPQALALLNTLNANQEGLDLAHLHWLLGIAQMGMKNYPAALGSFNQAIKNGQTDPSVYLYLAEIQFGLKDYAATLAAIGKAKSNYQTYPSMLEMKMQSHWLLGQRSEAWEAVILAQKLFPTESKYLQQQIVYALELGLLQKASELAHLFLGNPTAKAEDHASIGNSLRINRQFGEAAIILEKASLLYPHHPNITKALAYTYIDQGKFLIAANILEETAREHPEFISEAAELHMRAGNLQHALLLNAQVADQAKKLKQRLAILLALKHYEQILHMEDALAFNRQLSDQNIRYALAYAAFSIGEYAKAKDHLKFIKDPALFKQATELRRLMQECQNVPIQCV